METRFRDGIQFVDCSARGHSPVIDSEVGMQCVVVTVNSIDKPYVNHEM